MTRIAHGTYTGTTAAVNISLGFAPTKVRVVNVTDGDDAWEWFDGMTAGHALYTRSLTDNATTGNSSMSRITSNGISPYGGSGSAAPGFTAGTALSESAKLFAYEAILEDDFN
jgi:hypothetical protein